MKENDYELLFSQLYSLFLLPQDPLYCQSWFHVQGPPLLCDHAAMLYLHCGLVWSSFCLFPQDEVWGGVAASAHIHDQV